MNALSSPLARAHLVGMILLAASSPARAQSACPQSTLQFPGGTPILTTAPTFDQAGGANWIRGDHRIGEYSLHSDGSLALTDVVARDRFDVTGVPPGTPVTVLLKLSVAGFAYTNGCSGSGCCGMLVATVRNGADTAQTVLTGNSFSGRGGFSGVVYLPVTLIAGTPHTLEVEMWARRCPGGAHTVDATGNLEFDGPDPHAAVVSCKGFGPEAVPVLPASWGRIKLIYR